LRVAFTGRPKCGQCTTTWSETERCMGGVYYSAGPAPPATAPRPARV